MSDRPFKKFRIGYVTAAVWKNDGTNSPFYTVTLQRSYKDGEEYKNTDSFMSDDLLNAARVLQRAEDYISGLT